MTGRRWRIGWPGRLALGLPLGALGGALTFAHYRGSLYPAATPLPGWTPLAVAVAMGVAVAALTLELPDAVGVLLVSVLASLPAYLALLFAPQLAAGWGGNALLWLFTYGLGGQGITAWLLFFPMAYGGSYGTAVLVDEWLLG